MRWKAGPEKEKKSWRVVTGFAFFPVRTTLPSNSTVIWLERYQKNQQIRTRSNGCGSRQTLFWHTQQIAPMGYWSKEAR